MLRRFVGADGSARALPLSRSLRSDCTVCTGRGSRPDCAGNALVEFALVLPVFVLMTAGLMNLGSMLWQLSAVSDAIRYGARTSANSSNFDGTTVSCSTLASRAASNADAYVSSAKINRDGWWTDSTGTTAAGTWGTATWGVSGNPDYVQVPFVSVTMNTDPAKDNCMLCFANVLRHIQVGLSTSFAIESGSCV